MDKTSAALIFGALLALVYIALAADRKLQRIINLLEVSNRQRDGDFDR